MKLDIFGKAGKTLTDLMVKISEGLTCLTDRLIKLIQVQDFQDFWDE